MIRTRAAQVADHAFLKDLHHSAYREVVTRQFGKWVEADQDAWFEEKLSEVTYRIIELDDTPIGALSVVDAPGHVFLAELQIAPEFQNRGIGSTIVREEVDRAKALGRPIRLRVLLQNRAVALYERLGFTVTGETETHYLMTRELR